MSSWHQYVKEEESQCAEAIVAAGIAVGDYVCVDGWYGDIWAEVNSLYLSDNTHRSFTYFTWNTRPTSYDRLCKIRRLHRRTDPWDHLEVRSVTTATGKRGDGRPPTSLPDEFRYQGTYSLIPWLWNYCGRNVVPRTEKSLSPFCEIAGVGSFGIPWYAVDEVIAKIQAIRINGWSPRLKRVAEQTFGFTKSFHWRSKVADTH